MRIKKISETTPTQSQIINNYSDSIKDTYSCDYVNSMDRYSTDEVKTNKVWIDGKPIYRKTIILNSGWVVGSETTLNHNIANVDLILKYEGLAERQDGQNQQIPNYFGNSDWILSIFDITSTNYKIMVGSGFSAKPLSNIYITFEYTKN